MFIVAQHEVTDRSAFWAGAQQGMGALPSHLKLHHDTVGPRRLSRRVRVGGGVHRRCQVVPGVGRKGGDERLLRSGQQGWSRAANHDGREGRRVVHRCSRLGLPPSRQALRRDSPKAWRRRSGPAFQRQDHRMSSGALSRSLASWKEAHGFGILCIITPLGEHFAVHPSGDAAAFAADQSRLESWAHLSELQVKEWLVQRGLPSAEADDGIDWRGSGQRQSREPVCLLSRSRVRDARASESQLHTDAGLSRL